MLKMVLHPKSREKKIEVNRKEKGIEELIRRIIGFACVISFLFVNRRPFLDIYLQMGMAEWNVPFPIVKAASEW
jgi:hypothetical protein